jgi:hypothetical protein
MESLVKAPHCFSGNNMGIISSNCGIDRSTRSLINELNNNYFKIRKDIRQVFYLMYNHSNIMDDITFQKLKESKYYHPEITAVVYDSDKMLEMGLIAINSAVYGFDIVWDKIWFSFLWKYFKDGIHLAEKQAKEKCIKLRLIVEITKDNMDFINSIKYHDIKHLDGIRGNFCDI